MIRVRHLFLALGLMGPALCADPAAAQEMPPLPAEVLTHNSGKPTLTLQPQAPKRERAVALEIDRSERIKIPEPAATVFVVNPGIADVQMIGPDMALLYGRSVGETSLVVLDEENRELYRRLLVVRRSTRELDSLLQSFLPDHTIDVTPVPGGMILDGEVNHATQVDDVVRLAQNFLPEGGQIINRLRITGPTQVSLYVRIAEVSRTINKQFGINWNTAIDIGTTATSFATGDPISVVGGLGQGVGDTDTIFFGINRPNFDLNGLVNALAAEGLVTVLAEPSLTAMSGETSSFLAGGEFPVPVPQGDGTISIEYQPFGVSLAFTPTIINGDRINLRVIPEVSELSFTNPIEINNTVLPTVITRRASTTVELGSGQSLVIGGLLQNTTNQNVNKFPLLGDVPVLGALFRSTAFQKAETELVILVTPYFVKPSNAPLATPLDGFHVANDLSRILLGRLADDAPAPRPAEETLPEDALVGPAGFQME